MVNLSYNQSDYLYSFVGKYSRSRKVAQNLLAVDTAFRPRLSLGKHRPVYKHMYLTANFAVWSPFLDTHWFALISPVLLKFVDGVEKINEKPR